MKIIEFKTTNGLILEALELDKKEEDSLCYCQNRIFWYNPKTLECRIIVEFAILPDLERMIKDVRDLPF